MTETPSARRVAKQPFAAGSLRFLRWFLKSRFALMGGYADLLSRDPSERDVGLLRARFLEAVRHAERVLLARGVVTLLLAFGAVTTVTTAVLGSLALPEGLEAPRSLTALALRRVESVAGSLTLVLLALRLAFSRYLDLIDVTATYTAIALAGASKRGPQD
jgi:hypothetical protein